LAFERPGCWCKKGPKRELGALLGARTGLK
jgi:hypothetical protein